MGDHIIDRLPILVTGGNVEEAELVGTRRVISARLFDRIAGIDARDGRVAVQGWSEQSDVSALDLARRFEDAGVAAIVFTDIGRDGMLSGINIEATVKLGLN